MSGDPYSEQHIMKLDVGLLSLGNILVFGIHKMPILEYSKIFIFFVYSA